MPHSFTRLWFFPHLGAHRLQSCKHVGLQELPGRCWGTHCSKSSWVPWIPKFVALKKKVLVRDVFLECFFRRRKYKWLQQQQQQQQQKGRFWYMSPKSKKSCFVLCFKYQKSTMRDSVLLRLESSWDKARAVDAKEELEKLTKDWHESHNQGNHQDHLGVQICWWLPHTLDCVGPSTVSLKWEFVLQKTLWEQAGCCQNSHGCVRLLPKLLLS